MRRVKQGQVWHQATDNLAGIDTYGTYGTPTSDFSFSLAWSALSFTKFLFMTGICIPMNSCLCSCRISHHAIYSRRQDAVADC